MKINGIDFNLEKAAQDIAFLYAKKQLDSDGAFDKSEVENILQDYINAFVQVASKDADALKALLR